jgi:hypothetical protein
MSTINYIGGIFQPLWYGRQKYGYHVKRKDAFMKRFNWFCLILTLFALAGCVCAPQKNMTGTSDLRMLTEEYPPVTFMKDGKVTGFVTDMVREITARQGIPDKIRLTSWDEAYKAATSNPNVVLFSAERTKKREKLFQWVGPVGKNSAILYAKKGSSIRINGLEEAKKIAAIAMTTDWFTEQYLKGKGFPYAQDDGPVRDRENGKGPPKHPADGRGDGFHGPVWVVRLFPPRTERERRELDERYGQEVNPDPAGCLLFFPPPYSFMIQNGISGSGLACIVGACG